MKRVELQNEGPFDHHITRMLKNWTMVINPARHNRQRILQRAALMHASQCTPISLRRLVFDSWQSMAALLFDIADQPALLSGTTAFAPVSIYRGELDYFTTRLASQQIVNMGVGLGLFATP